VAELYSRGVHQSSASIEVGNPTLAAERLSAGALGITWNQHKLRMKGSAYLHYFSGYINLIPQYPPALTVAGVLPVFEYRQQDALFSGVEGEAAYTIVPTVDMGVTVALVRAQDVNTQKALLQIPADRYRGYATWQGEKLWSGLIQQPFIRGDIQVVRTQTRPGNLLKDSLDYADAPKGYALVGITVGGAFHISKKDIATFSVEGQNLLNSRYRDYLDRFRYYADAPGRNIIFRLTVPISFF
jgi:iron complex outermembrane receptor protein